MDKNYYYYYYYYSYKLYYFHTRISLIIVISCRARTNEYVGIFSFFLKPKSFVIIIIMAGEKKIDSYRS